MISALACRLEPPRPAAARVRAAPGGPGGSARRPRAGRSRDLGSAAERGAISVIVVALAPRPCPLGGWSALAARDWCRRSRRAGASRPGASFRRGSHAPPRPGRPSPRRSAGSLHRTGPPPRCQSPLWRRRGRAPRGVTSGMVLPAAVRQGHGDVHGAEWRAPRISSSACQRSPTAVPGERGLRLRGYLGSGEPRRRVAPRWGISVSRSGELHGAVDDAAGVIGGQLAELPGAGGTGTAPAPSWPAPRGAARLSRDT